MSTIREQIEQAYRNMEQAFYRADADALTEIYSDDAVWFVPGAPAIQGRTAITEVWKNVIGPGGSTLRVNIGELQESGDWAYEAGTFTTTSPEGTLANSGKYLVIWQRQSDGTWKTHRDLFHWDVPPAGA